MDLVESEEAFRPALSYALGAALVCDSLEDAQELCFTKGEKVCSQNESCCVLSCHVLYCTLRNSQHIRVMLMSVFVPLCLLHASCDIGDALDAVTYKL